MLLIALIIVSLLIIIVYYHYKVNEMRKMPTSKLLDLPLKTGDVIMTRCDYVSLIEPVHYLMFNLTNMIISGGLETHAGVVIVKNSIPYLYQVDFTPTYDILTDSYKWKAPILTTLTDYVMSYTGECIYHPIKTEIDINFASDFMMKNKERDFTINQLRWGNTLLKVPSKHDPDIVFCVQLVAEFLQEAGVLKLDCPAHVMNPQDLKRVMDTSGNFDPPKLILNSYLDFVIYGNKQTFL